MKTITNSVVRTIAVCIHYQRSVIVASIVLAILCGWYAATHFTMTTDINQLISSTSPARQRELVFEKAFPQFDTIIAVINAPTPELAAGGGGGAGCAAVRAEGSSTARSCSRRAAPFFAQSGLLFLTPPINSNST